MILMVMLLDFKDREEYSKTLEFNVDLTIAN
jgi:hypothetical protein